jgi:hypothetical protein
MIFRKTSNRAGAAAGLLTLAGLATSPNAAASQVSQNLTVKVTLAAVCNMTNSPSALMDFGTYTPFATLTTSKTATFTFQCARGMVTPSLTLNGATGTAWTVDTATNSSQLIKGLGYSLSLTGTPAATGTGLFAGTSAIATVVGVMPGLQAGAFSAAVNPDSATAVHTVWLNY